MNDSRMLPCRIDRERALTPHKYPILSRLCQPTTNQAKPLGASQTGATSVILPCFWFVLFLQSTCRRKTKIGGSRSTLPKVESSVWTACALDRGVWLVTPRSPFRFRKFNLMSEYGEKVFLSPAQGRRPGRGRGRRRKVTVAVQRRRRHLRRRRRLVRIAAHAHTHTHTHSQAHTRPQPLRSLSLSPTNRPTKTNCRRLW